MKPCVDFGFQLLTVYSVQESPKLSRLEPDFSLGDGFCKGAQVIRDHSLFFAVDDRVDPTSRGPEPVDSATMSLGLIEYAKSSMVPQLSITLPVEAHKLCSIMSCRFQEANIRSRK